MLEVRGDVVRVGLEASSEVVVEGLVAEGPLALDGATTWMSNGFHSWSQTGALVIGALPTDETLFAALAETGDTEVLRDGTALSWELTVVGGGSRALLVGAIDSARFRPWTQVGRGDAGLMLRAGSGGVDRVSVASGETVWGEPFRVAFGDVEPLLRDHAAALPARASAASAEAGWNSWYELWDGVDEAAVRANAAAARTLLAPRAGTDTLRVVVDDGWQQAWGDWLPNDRFPSGLDGLATDLRADGFEMGVWLAPLLVAEGSDVATAHPDWLVEGASYLHAKNGTMRVLDVTHPDAAAHLRATIERIVGWGYGLLKIDFLFAGTFEGGRVEDVTGMEAYHRALSIIREAAGEDTLLLTVGAPGLASLPYSDSWRVGGDIALEPFGAGWPWIPNQARTLAARWPYCARVLCDADPPILREPLTREEVETGAWVVAFAGGALFLSDDLRALDAARVDWLPAEVVTLSLGGEPALPEDYLPASPPRRLSHAIGDQVSRGGASTHVVPTTWRAPDGTRYALNVTEAEINVEGVPVPPRAVRPLP
ncbi:MAG: alpha-galactosidase [Sandaracinaceae bacterium]|nr:alpha-galactosidase [Sandaracinaceae bacterium]